MPLPEEVLEGLGHAKFYSTIDIREAFHQLVVMKEDRRKLAFWSSNKLYCWKRCPFGARNASAWFKRAIDRGHCGGWRDLLAASLTTCWWLERTRSRSTWNWCKGCLFDRLREVGLKCHPE
jgi:hypothetical protein